MVIIDPNYTDRQSRVDRWAVQKDEHRDASKSKAVTVVDSTGNNLNPSTSDNQELQLNRTITGYATPITYSLVTGTLNSGTIENAKHQDRTYMIINEVSGGLEIIFDFTLPSGQKMRRINFCGQYIGGEGHKIDVYIYNYNTSTWDEISTTNFKDILPTENDIKIVWDLDNDDYVDVNGNVRIRFKHDGSGDINHSLKIDCISCGDYKSPQLLADVGSKLDEIKVLTDRGYIELQAQGNKTQYDLPDPRIKNSNTNDIRCIGDMTDDADFKVINIPIVERFTNFTSVSASNRLNITAETPRKNLFTPQIWDDITYRLKHGKTIAFSEMTDKRILQTMIIFPTTVTDTLRIAWRIVPENATQKDFANTAFTVQEISQQGMGLSSYRIAIGNGETDIQIMRAEYSNGGLYIALEWTETSSGISYNGLYKISFNPDQGFSFMNMVISKASRFNNSKGIDLTKGRNGDIFYLKRTTTSISIYKNDNIAPMNYTFGNTYPGYTYLDGTGVMITPYYGDETTDTLLVANAFSSTSIGIYKMKWVQGNNINPPEFDLIIPNVTMATSLTRFTQMISLDTGEVQILYYDDDEGDYTSLTNTTFGDTGTYTTTYDVSTYQMLVSTDKIYFIRADGYQGTSSVYYISPKDLNIFAEAIIDFDDNNITFSKKLVSGSSWFILDFKTSEFIVKNEITYDVNGQAIRKPFLTKDTIYNASDVQINPATEEKQDSIITELQLKADLTETQPVQLQTGTNTAGKFVITNGGGDANTHSNCLFTIDYVDAVAHGLLSGYTVEFAAGRKISIGTGAFTILESQTFIQPPITPGDIQMYVQSTSSQDGVGGTGAQEITIEYFSLAWGARKTQVVVMNGITQVVIPNVDKYRIHKVYTNKGSRAVGDITITNIGETILYGQISQYRTYMERCIFYLAENETVTVTQAILGTKTSGGVSVVCFVTEEDASGNTVTRGRSTIGMADAVAIVDFKPHIVVSNPNNVPKAVGLSVTADVSNQKLIGTINGIIEVN